MTNRAPTLAVTALLVGSIASLSTVASATPIADALAIKKAAPTNVETVQWGWGVGPGLVGGVIIGGVLAAPHYGYGAYYPYPYYAPPAAYVVVPPAVYYHPRPYYAPGYYYGPRWGWGW
jgi:hypothetical protein